MAARLPPGCDPPPGRDPPPGDDDDFEEPKYLAKRKTQQAKNNNKRKAQEEPAASAAAKPRNKATKTSKATKKAVKPFWNRLTEAWSKLMPDCAESSCMPGDEPKVKVWCDVRATKIKALPPLEQPLHATLTAACKLQTNAAAHRAAWEAEQQKKAELKAAAAAKKKKKQQQQPDDDDDDDDDDDNNNDDNDDNGGGGQPPVYPGPVRSVKCRVQLTKLQLAKVKLWNAGTRDTYNSMAAHCNEHGLNISKKELRALFVNDAVLTGNSAWLKDIPYDVRDRATQDIGRAIKGFFTRLKNWKEKCDELRQASVREENLPKKPTCKFKFRSHRDDQCLEIRHRDWNRPYQHEQRNAKARDAGKKERSYRPSLYDDIFRPEVLACKRMPDGLPKTMAADFKLICDRRKRWFISMPQPGKQADMDTAPNNLHGVVALDPGARCFNTCFSSDGQIIEFGCLPKRPHLTKSERRRQRQQEREELDRLSPEERAARLAAKKRQSLTSIVSLCHIADQKASQHDRVKFVKPERPLSMSKKEWTKALCKERRRVKRTKAKLHERYLAILERIRNKTREAHNKLALFLCRNFRVILIPTFNMHDMIKRGERKLHKKTVRALAGWSHGRFRQTLQAKAELFPWVTVKLCDEHHTSKTCSSCGEIHEKLGGKKTFVCPSCGYRADRDCSAARNILLRYLTVNAVPSPCNMATPLLTPR